jgi:hypothetical protein
MPDITGDPKSGSIAAASASPEMRTRNLILLCELQQSRKSFVSGGGHRDRSTPLNAAFVMLELSQEL